MTIVQMHLQSHALQVKIQKSNLLHSKRLQDKSFFLGLKVLKIYSTCNDLTSYGIETIFDHCYGLTSFHFESFTGKKIASKVRREEYNGRPKLKGMMRGAKRANITVMTFIIKKRIDTELFIDRKQGLYIHKRDKETNQSDLLEVGKLKRRKK